ncbi:hypothetical protein PIB30_028987 [Stylosanthes scabra]|uniref:Uncharacterized protein n=1 Tax=Stylosanthes scabra TaxID=79078 RepID=A0ABU6W9P4_9FABA|nr:hypothetical protein [Stylosanthes scabra]
MVEDEQAHRLKINSINDLIAALVTNEDHKRQYSPFDYNSCNFVTHSFYAWWGTYYKAFARSFDTIKAGADKLLAEDQPQHPKTTTKRRKTKDDRIPISNPVQKTQPSSTPTASTKSSTKSVSPEDSATHFDALLGTKISELLQAVSQLCQGSYPQSPPSNRSKSLDPEPNNTRQELPLKEKTSNRDDTTLNQEKVAEPQANIAASETVIEGVGHSDLVKNSIQLEGAKKVSEEPIVERQQRPIATHKPRFSPEVLKAIRWLIDLLSAPIEANVKQEEVQQRVNLARTKENKLEEELASISCQIEEVEIHKKNLQGPLDRSKKGLAKVDSKFSKIANKRAKNEKMLAEVKQAEKEEGDLRIKFLESQKETRLALEDILQEYQG